MFQYNFTEFLVRERQQQMLAEAARQRLIHSFQPQDQAPAKIREWLGRHMVTWGLKLQGYGAGAVPELALPGIGPSQINFKC